jgi:hypothetical protein
MFRAAGFGGEIGVIEGAFSGGIRGYNGLSASITVDVSFKRASRPARAVTQRPISKQPSIETRAGKRALENSRWDASLAEPASSQCCLGRTLCSSAGPAACRHPSRDKGTAARLPGRHSRRLTVSIERSARKPATRGRDVVTPAITATDSLIPVLFRIENKRAAKSCQTLDPPRSRATNAAVGPQNTRGRCHTTQVE